MFWIKNRFNVHGEADWLYEDRTVLKTDFYAYDHHNNQ